MIHGCHRRNAPVFCLDFSSIFQYSHINEKVGGRLEASGQINVGPLALVSGQKIAVQANIFLLFGTETACATLCIHCGRVCHLIVADNVDTLPAHVF